MDQDYYLTSGPLSPKRLSFSYSDSVLFLSNSPFIYLRVSPEKTHIFLIERLNNRGD